MCVDPCARDTSGQRKTPETNQRAIRAWTSGRPFGFVYPMASSRPSAASAAARAAGGAGVAGWPTSMCSTSTPLAWRPLALVSTSITLNDAIASDRRDAPVGAACSAVVCGQAPRGNGVNACAPASSSSALSSIANE